MDIFPSHILEYKVRRESINKLAELVVEASRIKPVNVDVSMFSWENRAKDFDSFYRKVLCKNTPL